VYGEIVYRWCPSIWPKNNVVRSNSFEVRVTRN
jgi:hypothetical protein